MTSGIPEAQLSRLSEFVAARMGLHFQGERLRDLERAILAASREWEIEGGRSCVEWLLSSLPARGQIEILAKHLTIGETYFFRTKKLFGTLEKSILSKLIRSRRRNGRHLRIWSAGCSSGEEPYSAAILLSKMIPDLQDWNITILATDINPCALQKAADAVYGPWSFRDVQPEIKDAFFKRRRDGRFDLLPRIREMVTFSYLNLVEDAYPSPANNTNAVDIIFCRNVLMYLVPELAGKVVRNFHRSLVDGGFLIVSPSESASPIFPQFTTINASGTILFKKENPRRAGAFPSRPLEGPRSAVKPAVTPVPATAPVLEPADVRIIPRTEAHDTPPEPRISNSGIQIRQELYREASALFEGGCYPEAVEKTERVLSQNPSDANGLALLARIYADWSRLDKALEWCEKAITAERLRAGYHYLMATILQELGRTEDAVVSLKRTRYLDPQFIPAYVALGNISRKSGRRKESIRYFENALSLLNSKRPEDVLTESEGINAERLTEIIKTIRQAEIER